MILYDLLLAIIYVNICIMLNRCLIYVDVKCMI